MGLKVHKIKYWETPKGIGYVAGTKYGDIINMGQGGATYFQRCDDKGRKYENSLLYPEWRLEKAIDDFELRAQELLDFGNSREKMQGVGMLEAIAHIKHTLLSP